MALGYKRERVINFEEPEKFDLEILDFCQTCLAVSKTTELKDMTRLYTHNGSYEMYSEMLDCCFSLQLEDNYKKVSKNIYMICNSCIEELRIAVIFRKRVEEAQMLIKKILEINETTKFETSMDDQVGNDDVNENLSSEADSYEMSHFKHLTKKIMEIKSSEIMVEPEPSQSNECRPIKKKKKSYILKLPYHVGNTDLQCKICSEEFASNKTLKMHMPKHFPYLTCEYCGRGFSNRSQLKSHMSVHSTKRFECPSCPGKTFKSSSGFRFHHKIKHEASPFVKCHLCSECFTTYDSKRNHLINEHGVKFPRVKCKICDMTFARHNKISEHVRKVHLNERTHVCDVCKYAFFSKRELNMHMLKHTGTRNFPCEVCKKRFPRKTTLSQHMKIHTGEKNHICSICSKAFTQKCSLKGHMALHDRRDLTEEES